MNFLSHGHESVREKGARQREKKQRSHPANTCRTWVIKSGRRGESRFQACCNLFISALWAAATGVTGIPNGPAAPEPASVVQPVTAIVISTLECVLGLNRDIEVG